ncbi:hypothetical protein AGMMS49928_27300 [Spirochaetia bacterium]|nr:hypothetical protein AGMMS49928_27300 [Spirochaetia bacterium]
MTESGLASSLRRGLELIRTRKLGSTEFGRVMTAVNVTLLQKLYVVPRNSLPVANPPPTHVYTRILQDAERGVYTQPPDSSRDYLEYVLPSLALIGGGRNDRLQRALEDLQKARRINGDSVLASWLLGLCLEQTGAMEEAAEEYRRVWESSRECYPAALGLARVLDTAGRKEEAHALLVEVFDTYPDSLTVRRQLALTYYHNRDWDLAEPLVTMALNRDNRDGELILIRAHIWVEQGQFLPAQGPLDQYAAINPHNPLYLFLRARLQFEGNRNRDAALSFIRTMLRSSSSPPSDEALIYAVRLLMDSSRPEDMDQGRDLLRSLLDQSEKPPLPVINLALDDAIRREDWPLGRVYAERLLEERRSLRDLFQAYTVEQGLGNSAAALAYIEELYTKSPDNNEWTAAYISALINAGRRVEAGRMIDSRLAGLAGGSLKGRYYFLRSRLRTGEEAAMNDLRSCLFEDPRNLDALIALFEIYHRRKDERRAVYYLKQALAYSPENPLLKRYEAEYAPLLGGY